MAIIFRLNCVDNDAMTVERAPCEFVVCPASINRGGGAGGGGRRVEGGGRAVRYDGLIVCGWLAGLLGC